MASDVPRGPPAGGNTRPLDTVAPGAISAWLEELVQAPAARVEGREPAAGTVIGRFELVRRLGAGGFGVVWEARDHQLGRAVAFKLVRPGKQADLREQSLLHEAEAAARLSHDNIVALYDVGSSEYGPYLVLELLRGRTLAERLEGEPLEPRRALRIFRDVVRGVAYAHAEGVVHRDLKPGNIFLCDDGRVKVLDFGLARAFGRRRQSGGTPAYMAPEQRTGAPEDERTDVFALGVLLFRLLARTLPFASGEETTSKRRAPLLEVADAPQLGELVGRMLEKDPLKRPRDAGEVLAQVEVSLAALESSGSGSRPDAVHTRRYRPRRLLQAVGAVVALGLATAVGGIASRRWLNRDRGKTLVAVADVVNETGEKELDVLSGLLVTALEQSRKLEVMTQTRMLDLAASGGHPGATRVDEALGREVGRRSHAAALLLPAVRRLGATYAVEMRAVDPVRDEHLFTLTDRTTSRDGLLDLLDRLSDETRRELREDPAEQAVSHVRVGEAMTRSIEAYQHYLAGIEAYRRDGQRAAGLREFLEAVRLDPQFAAAHEELGVIYDAYTRSDVAAPHKRAAEDFAGRMPEKERTQLLLLRARAKARNSKDPKDTVEALRLADLVVARFPADKLGLTRAAATYLWMGKQDLAVATFRRALELDPGFFLAMNGLASTLGPGTKEAIDVARSAVAARRSSANVALLAYLQFEGGDPNAAATAREALRLDAGQSTLNAGNACEALIGLGELEECLLTWRRMAADGPNQYERDTATGILAQGLAFYRGKIREALRLVDPFVQSGILDPLVLLAFGEVGRPRIAAPQAEAAARRLDGKADRALRLAFFGRVDEAERIAASLAPAELDPDSESFYRALVASGRGRPAEAVEVFRHSLARSESSAESAGGRFEPAYLLAEALLAAGRPAEAAAVWPAKVHGRFGDPWDYGPNYPRLALVRAHAMEQLGRRADALKELDALLAVWKDADDDLPLVIEARTMRARLASATR